VGAFLGLRFGRARSRRCFGDGAILPLVQRWQVQVDERIPDGGEVRVVRFGTGIDNGGDGLFYDEFYSLFSALDIYQHS
jgi:hypothetical protein